MAGYSIHSFPSSRLATLDVCAMGKRKHHIAALLEVDVTLSRQKVKQYKREVGPLSYTAWLVKVIGHTLSQHPQVAAYLNGKCKAIEFHDVNVSFLIEKELNGQKVPFPLLIEKANELSLEALTRLLSESKALPLNQNDVVLQRKSTRLERFYYHLPGFLRRYCWALLLKHPRWVFSKMGNVAITSVGMMGQINGWFIPLSVHPVCIGLGAIIKKPVVVNDQIVIREVMNLTVLLDHDVLDGAPMVRFINQLTKNIEQGILL